MRRRIRTLVVDDNPVAMKAICSVVDTTEALDLVGTAGNGVEALAQMQTLHPQLILMDFIMPRMSGLEATVRLRQRFPTVRVVIVTDHQDKNVRHFCLEIGAHGFVAKAQLAQELDGQITRLFGAPGRNENLERNAEMNTIERRLNSKIAATAVVAP